MTPPNITGNDAFSRNLRQALHARSCALLINANRHASPETIIAQTTAFATAATPGQDTLIVTILHQTPQGLPHLAERCSNAALWAFTQTAALDWAPRGIRVNAIGLGASPAGPFDSQEQSGRPAAPTPAAPATIADIARTIAFLADCPSITGQIVRLGALPE